MKDSTLGTLIDSTAQRDAIHIAIAPVTAGARLAPGTHVGFLGDGENVGVCNAPIGIVDPFLERAVNRGERFFLCLYPRTITSLRHEWTHPSFSTVGIRTPEIAAAIKRLTDFGSNIGWTYERVLETLTEAIETGGAHGGDDTTADNFNDNKADLMAAAAVITGKVPKDIEGTYFSCAC